MTKQNKLNYQNKSTNKISIQLSSELVEIFEKAAVVLMLINKEGRVININKTGIEMIGKNKENILGLLGGEVFNCINARSEGKPVCGTGRDCTVRNNVNNTFLTGKESEFIFTLQQNA